MVSAVDEPAVRDEGRAALHIASYVIVSVCVIGTDYPVIEVRRGADELVDIEAGPLIHRHVVVILDPILCCNYHLHTPTNLIHFEPLY